jgi:hypothetical protein
VTTGPQKKTLMARLRTITQFHTEDTAERSEENTKILTEWISTSIQDPTTERSCLTHTGDTKGLKKCRKN